MRNRDAWLAAIAAALGISEEACRRDAAPPVQQIATAAASSRAPAVAETVPAPSASAVASASATPSASAPVATIAKPPSSDAAKLSEISQAICGAVPNMNIVNGSCGASNRPPPNIGNLNPSCGGTAIVPNNNAVRPPQAQIALSVSGGASGDERVAMGLRPRLRACANQALAQDPSQQGKLVVVAKVGPNGDVTSADVASNSGLSASSAQCMARGVRNAQFPAGAARTITLAIAQTKQSP